MAHRDGATLVVLFDGVMMTVPLAAELELALSVLAGDRCCLDCGLPCWACQRLGVIQRVVHLVLLGELHQAGSWERALGPIFVPGLCRFPLARTRPW